MPEQTNPAGGVVSDEDRVLNFLSQPQGQGEENEDPSRAQPVEQPESQASEELTPDDLEAGREPSEQPSVEAFEIVHNGQEHKLSREEAIKYAMQGFDYTHKTQAVAEKDRAVSAHLERLAQIEQVAPHVLGQRAQIAALEAQLGQFQGVNWVQEAANDPGRYAQLRAQFDTLRDTHAQAVNQFQRTFGQVQQQLQGVQAQRLRAEAARLPELVPEWKDEAKLESAKAQIAQHYRDTYGIDPRVLDSKLTDAVSMAVVYKAMKYDQLVKAKGDKVNQLRTAPPVARPGVASSRDSARADKDKDLTQRLRKSGDVKDAAALLLNRMK